ncbi:MAG: ATP-binding protein [Myxococcota bacterium]
MGGIRFKLFTASFLAIMAAGSVTGWVLEGKLRHWLVLRTETTLAAQAHTVREAIAALSPLDPQRLDPLVRSFSDAAGNRITLIASDGQVLADSNVPRNRLPLIENHGERPEVKRALQGEVGTARRHSRTVQEDLMYVALPLTAGVEDILVVRVAMPLQHVADAIARLRWFLVGAGLVGLVLAFGLSLLASYMASRPLLRLVEYARMLAARHGETVEATGADELSGLAGSLNRMAEQLEHSMATLASERSRFETVLQGMSEAVLVLDAQQRVTLVNPATLALLGLERSPVGEPLLDVVRVPSLNDLARKGLFGPASTEFPVGGSASRRILGRAQPLPSAQGTVIVMHDVTEMRRLELVRKDFVANVSHELRTPVSIIRANAETLLDGALDDPERARSFVEALHRNSERLSRIIADLLDLSRIEAGRYQFELGPVRLEGAMRRAVEAVEPKAEHRDIKVEVSMHQDISLWADAKALDQVLLNLLDNSIKYTPEGGHVAVRAEQKGGLVRIEVQDDGPGIKAQHRARIFERFYRIDPGRSRDMGGTGLGLAIVKHFVESMRGAVGVEPAFPRGSIFWVTLPTVDSVDAGRPSDRKSRSGETIETEIPQPTTPMM